MIPTLLLSTILILIVSFSTSGQTNDRQTGGPFVAKNGEPPLVNRLNNNRSPVSPQSRAEAKRLYKEGVKYGRAGLPKQSAQIFERAIELDPDYADAYYGLGHAYFDLGQWDKAIQSLRTLIKFLPDDIQGRDLLARVEAAQQRERGSSAPPKEAVATPETKQPETQVAANIAPASAPASATANSSPSNGESEAAQSLTSIYRVGVGDVLDVRLTDAMTNASSLFTIAPSGLLEHPNLPDPLPVAGLTVEDIAAALRADLKRRALNDTKVWVGVRDYASHAVLVSGLVKEPGTKILRREAIPLYVVIADAQPLPEAARLNLMRNRTNEFFSIDLTEPKEMNRLVLPGDVITVQPNVIQFFYVSGEVKSPGEKTFRRGLTLTQALMVAGGVTAKPKEARIAREDSGGFLVVTSYKLKDIESGKLRDPLIQAGDRITIVN